MVEMETQAADCVNAGIRMKKDLGFLHLEKIDQEYIQDPDLSKILEKQSWIVIKQECLKANNCV